MCVVAQAFAKALPVDATGLVRYFCRASVLRGDTHLLQGRSMSQGTFRDVVLGMLERAPVLVLVDGRHPEHRGLPDGAASGVVLLQLAGTQGQAVVQAGAETALRVPYGAASGMDLEAVLAMAGVFGLLGVRPDGTAGLLTHGNLPPCLGQHPEAGLQLLLEALGIAPRQTWALQIDEAAVLEGRTALEPDKRTAFLRAREAHDGSVWVLARGAVPGTQPPAAHAQMPAFGVRIMPATPGLAIDDDALRWDEATPQGPHRVVVPWAAVGIVQSPDYQLGWAWIDDLPAEMVATPRLAVLRNLAGGVPIPAPPLPPCAVLAPPHHATVQEAVQWAAALGGVVLLDRHRAGVHVPRGLEGQPIVAVPFGSAPHPTVHLLDADGLVATMPDAAGNLSLVKAPWTAVLAVTVSSLVPRAWPFHDHASDALLQSLPPTGVPGQQVFSFDQPLGGRMAEGRAVLHIEYVVHRNALH